LEIFSAPKGLEYFAQDFNAGLYTQFVGRNKASLDGVNEYRLEAYATLLFGASSDTSRSCGKTITAGPPRQRDSVK
jgi:hypothetical protein